MATIDSSNNKNVIRASGLRKLYRTEEVETTALSDVSLDVDEGEFVAVVGPSGCGKSTLLNVLGLLDTPTGGRYSLMGEDTAGRSEQERTELRRRHIGFVFQNFNLIEELTVFENVELPLLYSRVPREERASRVDGVLDRMQLTARKGHFPRQLSGGQQQRVAVARAVVSQPRLVLADEPTGNLDSSHGEEVMDLLADVVRRGTTIVMVTHSGEFAARADRIIRMMDGRISTGSAEGGRHV